MSTEPSADGRMAAAARIESLLPERVRREAPAERSAVLRSRREHLEARHQADLAARAAEEEKRRGVSGLVELHRRFFPTPEEARAEAAQNPVQEPTQAPVQEWVQEMVQESGQEAGQEPRQEPRQEPGQEPRQEADQEARHEPQLELTQEPVETGFAPIDAPAVSIRTVPVFDDPVAADPLAEPAPFSDTPVSPSAGDDADRNPGA